MDRILVAASAEAQPRLQRMLGDADADYAVSFAGGVEALLNQEYSQIVVDVGFAGSRALGFAEYASEQQPSAHLVCVNASGRPLDPGAAADIELALQGLGYEGVVTLGDSPDGTERRLAERDRRVQPRSSGARDRRALTAQ
jgi:hypothetical protein